MDIKWDFFIKISGKFSDKQTSTKIVFTSWLRLPYCLSLPFRRMRFRGKSGLDALTVKGGLILLVLASFCNYLIFCHSLENVDDKVDPGGFVTIIER